MSIFFVFLNFLFLKPRRCFFILWYRKKKFLCYIALKKKSWKNGNLWTKTMGWLLWKNINFSTFWTSCFYRLQRRFFVLQYRKRHFPGLYCLKKKVGTRAMFGPKPWLNPFGKMTIFRVFELLVFIAWKGVFRSRMS